MTEPEVSGLDAVADALERVSTQLSAAQAATAGANARLAERLGKIERRQRNNRWVSVLVAILFAGVMVSGALLLASIRHSSAFLQSCFDPTGSCYKKSIAAQRDPRVQLTQSTIAWCNLHSATPAASVRCIQDGLAAIARQQHHSP